MSTRTKKIKIDTEPIKAVDSFDCVDDTVEKKKKAKEIKPRSKKAKPAETKKDDVESVVGESTKSKKKSSTSSKDTVTKKATKLVDKKASTVGSKIKESKEEVLEKKSRTSKYKKTVEKTEEISAAEKIKAKLDDKASKVRGVDKKKTEVKIAEKPKRLEETAEILKEKAKKTVKKLDNRGIDFLVSFDTTGSMYPVLSQVRREVEKLVTELFNSIKDIRIGVIVHGDYCDAGNPYTIRALEFTKDLETIREFIRTSDKTYGGDADECYELVLKTAREDLNWGDDRNKIMMVIGDANPHSPNYPMNHGRIDWVEESKALKEEDVRIFAVHALSYYRPESRKFYEKMASITGGLYLTLDQFSEVTNLILATCLSQYSEETLDEFVTIIRNKSSLTNGLARNLNRLYGREVITGITDDMYRADHRSVRTSRDRTDGTLVQKEGLIPVMPGRFQTIEVDSDSAIKQFVEDNGIEFKKGRAFYELSKSEKVQQYKEVIIQDRKTGEMFNGSQVREYLGLSPQIASGGVTERLNSKHTADFNVFVQSTSVNRKLIGGTKMLYEMSFE